MRTNILSHPVTQSLLFFTSSALATTTTMLANTTNSNTPQNVNFEWTPGMITLVSVISCGGALCLSLCVYICCASDKNAESSSLLPSSRSSMSRQDFREMRLH